MTKTNTQLAIIRQQYRPDGGAERFVERALNLLPTLGKNIEVSIMTRSWPSQQEAKFNVVTINPSKFGRISREKNFAHACQQEFGRFDLIQSHERIPGCHIFRAGDGVHKVWLEQKSKLNTPLQNFALSTSRYHKYVLQAEKEMFKHPNLKAVICNSQMVKDEIHQHFGVEKKNIHVIYNGVDQTRFSPNAKSQREAIRKQLNIPMEENVLIYVGSGFERKGLKAALEALALSRSSQHMIVVGKDKSEKKYQKLARNLGLSSRVHFVGKQNDTAPYYGAANALILPTMYDPFPNVIVEAMACGLAIITSTTCGGKEFVIEANCGYVCEPQNTNKLASYINELNNEKHTEQLGAAARQFIKPYTLEKVVEDLLELYNTIINK